MSTINFLCVGFAKCGTTTLHDILKQHNDIYLPIIKEPLYYYNREFYSKGFNWYKNRFYPHNAKQTCIGEINPLITLKENAKKVYQDFGDKLKIIFIMRNPVDRAFSHFKYSDRNIFIDIDKKSLSHGERFDYIVSQLLGVKNNQFYLMNTPYKHIITTGNYYNIINQYLQYYNRKNIKFLIFEEFINNPEIVCKELFHFLGININNDINYRIKSNEGNRIKRNETLGVICNFILQIRNNIILHTPYLGETFDLLLNKLYYIFSLLLTKKDNDKTKMSTHTRKMLEDYYREDKNHLTELIGKNLDNLWYI